MEEDSLIGSYPAAELEEMSGRAIGYMVTTIARCFCSGPCHGPSTWDSGGYEELRTFADCSNEGCTSRWPQRGQSTVARPRTRSHASFRSKWRDVQANEFHAQFICVQPTTTAQFPMIDTLWACFNSLLGAARTTRLDHHTGQPLMRDRNNPASFPFCSPHKVIR